MKKDLTSIFKGYIKVVAVAVALLIVSHSMLSALAQEDFAKPKEERSFFDKQDFEQEQDFEPKTKLEQELKQNNPKPKPPQQQEDRSEFIEKPPEQRFIDQNFKDRSEDHLKDLENRYPFRDSKVRKPASFDQKTDAGVKEQEFVPPAAKRGEPLHLPKPNIDFERVNDSEKPSGFEGVNQQRKEQVEANLERQKVLKEQMRSQLKKFDQMKEEGKSIDFKELRREVSSDFARPMELPEDFKENILLPPECSKAGVVDEDECRKLMFIKHAPLRCQKAGVSSEQECKRIMMVANMPKACQEANVVDEEECDKIMFKQHAPRECVEAGVSDERECEKIMFKKFGPKDCIERGLVDKEPCEKYMRETVIPKECEELGITDEKECEKAVFKRHAPRDCRDAGLETPEQCEELMIKRHLPQECRQAGASTKEECEKIMFKKFGPPECVAAGAVNRRECDKIMFKQHAPQECRQAGASTKEECEKIMFKQHAPRECVEANILDKDSCRKMMFKKHAPRQCLEQGALSPEECEEIMIKKHLPPACQAVGATTSRACDKVMARRHMPPECQDANIEDPQECERYMVRLFMPPLCKEKGAKSKYDCEIIMLNEQGRPDECEGKTDRECLRLIKIGKIKTQRLISRGELPPFCQQKGITDPDECEQVIKRGHVPPECREAGAFTREACEKVMFEKFGSRSQNIDEALPLECQDAGLADPQECKEFLRASFFPKECQENGISDEDRCEEFIRERSMPPICIENNIDNIDDCEEFIREQHLTGECREAGIVDSRACETFMIERYAKKVSCDQMDQEECQVTVQKRLLGRIVERRKQTEKIKEKLEKFVGQHIEAKEDKEIKEVLPVQPQEEQALLILPAEESTKIEADDDIVDVVPAVVVLDDDADGIPNDLEEDLGSDPNNADTDGDGISDGKEAQQGSDPTGRGALSISALPETEQAILTQTTLEQPATSGEAVDELTISTATVDIKDQEALPSSNTDTSIQQGDVQGAKVFKAGELVRLTGTAKSDKTYAVFIYSPIAIVSTVKTDESGVWNYKLDVALQDGEHQAYLAELDKDGKIVKKSSPLSFFVSTAYAQEVGAEQQKVAAKTLSTIQEVVVKTVTKPITSLYYRLLLIVLGLVVIAVYVLIRVIRKKRSLD